MVFHTNQSHMWNQIKNTQTSPTSLKKTRLQGKKQTFSYVLSALCLLRILLSVTVAKRCSAQRASIHGEQVMAVAPRIVRVMMMQDSDQLTDMFRRNFPVLSSNAVTLGATKLTSITRPLNTSRIAISCFNPVFRDAASESQEKIWPIIV